MNLGKQGTVVKEASSEVGGQWARSCDGATGTPQPYWVSPASKKQPSKRESGRRREGAGHTERRR